MTGFEGRVALITGGARGIGKATAARLVAGGATAAVLDIDIDAAKAAAAQLGNAIALACDITDAEQVDEVVDGLVAQTGRLDIVVNNAGVTKDNLLFKMTASDWDDVIAVHLKGAFNVTRAAQRHMVPARYGRIISLSSLAALGSRGQANYSAAKMGLQGFTRTVAAELGPFGITANAVAPGFVVTEMTDAAAARLGLTPEEFQARAAETAAVRRVGYPEDIANAIAFLASEPAGFITGQVLYVDGGARIS